ncbi:MAG: hypothetical protein FJ314_09070 [SAR202 cluster bacterium]|nr:hypothetical protein [SAR202 cluster bacterium]
MRIVDAHPHIYSTDRRRYPPIPDPWEPGEPATAEDLKRKMDESGVARAVFIQTSTFYGWDNRYVMAMSKKYSKWATGVVTLSPDDPGHLAVLEDAVHNYGVRGLRGTSDRTGRIWTPTVLRLWTRARDLGVVVNCMVLDDLDRVPEIERIAKELPDLRIVIDHCFMLNHYRKQPETLLALKRLSSQKNLFAKLTSGTHGSARVYPHTDMHAPLRKVIDWFGPGRCVWGSNFPNALWSKGTSYVENLSLFTDALGLSKAEQEGVLSKTAMTLWFPKDGVATT